MVKERKHGKYEPASTVVGKALYHLNYQYFNAKIFNEPLIVRTRIARNQVINHSLTEQTKQTLIVSDVSLARAIFCTRRF